MQDNNFIEVHPNLGYVLVELSSGKLRSALDIQFGTSMIKESMPQSRQSQPRGEPLLQEWSSLTLTTPFFPFFCSSEFSELNKTSRTHAQTIQKSEAINKLKQSEERKIKRRCKTTILSRFTPIWVTSSLSSPREAQICTRHSIWYINDQGIHATVLTVNQEVNPFYKSGQASHSQPLSFLFSLFRIFSS
ncbi:uncharacterized protein LOC133800456 isoform X3 [Humulus lupulus]|uniref:uncharacterized protein LOC133800456 isoform X3 n=1 Tax=Humulus lupulus TaxID=3486 RepID=UPI002B40ED9C|nr:uncharacterized protein LOC133800456 isoform X3 [Humulus lupulus]